MRKAEMGSDGNVTSSSSVSQGPPAATAARIIPSSAGGAAFFGGRASNADNPRDAATSFSGLPRRAGTAAES